MRKTITTGTLACLMASCAIMSCSKKNNEVVKSDEKATLRLDIGTNDAIVETSNRLKSTSPASFKVDICNQKNAVVLAYPSLADVPSSIDLEAGDYYVKVYSPNKQNAVFNTPYHFGQSDNFTLGRGEQKTIAVNCFIASAKVTVVYSDNVKKSFSNYIVTVKRQSDSLIFLKDDTRAGYFEPGKLDITAVFTYTAADGTAMTKKVVGIIPLAVGRKHHELMVDASKDQGQSTLNVTVNDSMSTETIIIAENTTTVTKTASQLVQGDLLISEIMPNPDKTTDDLGEWFEIYNNTNSAVNLNGLCIKSGTKTITLTIDATVAPGQYVFMCKDIQGGAGAIYYYGTALSLVNTSGNLQLYNSNKTGATLLSEMTYATSPTGASLSLDPSKLSFAAAQDPSSWCAAQAVYATGDKGTPGAQNQPCN